MGEMYRAWASSMLYCHSHEMVDDLSIPYPPATIPCMLMNDAGENLTHGDSCPVCITSGFT